MPESRCKPTTSHSHWLVSAIAGQSPILLLCTLTFVVTTCGCGHDPSVEPIKASVSFERMPVLFNRDGDWPWWKGGDHSSCSSDDGVAIEWSEDSHVVWKVTLTGAGHSSPIVHGSRILFTAADADRQSQSVLCINKYTGKTIWSTEVFQSGFVDDLHSLATYADATLACDGDRVFANFIHNGGLYVTALSMDGKRLWETRVGPYRTKFGFGSSPLVYRSFVIVCADDPDRGTVTALHRRTGEIVWRIRRPPTENGTYATPTIGHLDGRTQLLLPGAWKMVSLDPDDGSLLWTYDLPAEAICNTVAVSSHAVFVSGGTPGKATLCLHGKVSLDDASQRTIWRENAPSKTCYVTSPLYYRGMLFVMNDGGVLTCFDADTGKQHWQKRLRGTFLSSPVCAGGNLYVSNIEGTTFVISAQPECNLLATNTLDKGIFASPAIADGRIYLRTATSLYCIGQSAGSE